MSSKEIRNLVKAAKGGNAEAFGELYEIYSGELFSYACYYLGDRYRAEDAVSDAVCSAFSSVQTLRDPGAFKTWIFKILMRSCQKQLKYIIEQRSQQDIDALGDREAGGCDADEAEALKQALSSIGEEERQVVLLSAVGQYNSREIGRMLGIPASTVRSKLMRTTDKLYSFLNEERSEKDESGRKA
ncbi:MAG: sigma-70 family RNA polymerase sigma factor [Oscillospiraceae bacterium]|nr:sigma-70 family RNA polymerase sigma factor [Oscillospiraceae bacterium]